MKALRFVLVCMAVVLIAGLGWRLVHPHAVVPTLFAPLRSSGIPVASLPPVPPRPEATPTATTSQPAQPPDAAEARRLVLSRMADAPDYVPFFDRLRSIFPPDYLALVDEAAAAVAKGNRVPNPDRLMIDALRTLRQTRGVLAAQAADPQLSGIFTAQSGLLDALAADNPGLCVDFLYGGMSPSFMAFAATHRELVERVAMASLSAIQSGQESHIERDQPTAEDFEGLTADLNAKGLSSDEVSAVLDGKTFDPPLAEGRLCAAGQTYLKTLLDLPDAARLRIYALSAALLARS